MRLGKILFAAILSLSVLAPTVTFALEKVVVSQFGKEKFLLYIPLYVAMEEGIFAKHGIEIDLRFAGNDDQIFAAVMSGESLFGVGDPVFAAISKERGGPGKVVAMMITSLGLSGYTNKSTIPVIERPAQLGGLKISSFPAPSTTFRLISNLIEQERLVGTEIVQVAVGSQLAALEAGRVDIAIDLEPAVSIAESKGYRVVLPFDHFTPRQAITGITTLESTIADRPQLVSAMVESVHEALVLLREKPETAEQVGRKLFPTLSEQVVKRAVERMMGAQMYPASAVVEPELWQRTIESRLVAGELKKPQALEVAVDNSFAQAAASKIAVRSLTH